MFSDFSLKYLVTHWNTELLGKNPFVKVGEYSSAIKLRYDNEQLLKCVSTQLEKLGKLSNDKMEANVHAMGGTFAYSIDSKVKDSK